MACSTATKMVCFCCRHVAKVRNTARRDLSRCPHCRQPLRNVGPKARIPRKSADRSWRRFEDWACRYVDTFEHQLVKRWFDDHPLRKNSRA